MFRKEDLKSNIERRLKTYSQLKSQYNITGDIYRSGRKKYFSEMAKRYNLEGCPISRPNCRLELDENIKKSEDMFEPVWYSADLASSRDYCENPDCTTYAYIPRDESLVKKTRLVFLDLTGTYDYYVEHNGKKLYIYKLDYFIRQIYDYIFKKYKDVMFSHNGKNSMCVNNPCNDIYSIDQISAAYGYDNSLRDSITPIDRFFTIELFHLIDYLNIETDNNCKVMGYYHADLRDSVTKDTYFPAEFTIKYGYSVNKNYIDFKGEVPWVLKSVGGTKKRRMRRKRRSKKCITKRRKKIVG